MLRLFNKFVYKTFKCTEFLLTMNKKKCPAHVLIKIKS